MLLFQVHIDIYMIEYKCILINLMKFMKFNRLFKTLTIHITILFVIIGRNKFRPDQKSPIPNFTLAGDYTSQKYLGSMEGAGKHIHVYTCIYM
jgi:hypothetical protein